MLYCTLFRRLRGAMGVMLLGLLTPALAWAQPVSFQSWNAENGLSQNTVYAIGQDEDGFMWLGTRNGLNRFDGREFRVFKNATEKQEMPEFDITSLFFDGKNVLTGTSKGLFVFDQHTETFQKVTIESGKPDYVVYTIYQDRKKQIWLGSSLGLFCLEKRNPYLFKKFGTYGPGSIEDEVVRCIFSDATHNLWIGSNAGLTRIRLLETAPQYTTFKHDAKDPASISSNIITAIAEDRRHRLWVGTQSRGINLFDDSDETFTRINSRSPGVNLVNDNIRVIKSGSDDDIWVGTQEGLTQINWQNQAAVHYQTNPRDKGSLSQNSVHSLFIDKRGLLWIGTFFGGLNLMNPFAAEFQVWQSNGTPFGLSNNVVSSVAEDINGNLWIGTEGGGLNYYNRQSQTFDYFTASAGGLGSNLIKTIFKDSDDNIWVGTHAGGLNLYRNGEFKKYFHTPENAAYLRSEISAIAEDHEKNLWLGIQGNIQDIKIYHREGIELTDRSDEFDKTLVAGKNIKQIFPDPEGNVWIATSAGLFVVKAGSRKVQPFLFTAYGAYPLQITAIQRDSKGHLWLGTENEGLKKFNPQTQKLYTYTFKKSLADNDIFGVLEDSKGLLWLSTGFGIVKLNPETNGFQVFTKTDGLPSNMFNYNAYYKSEKGSFYFGGFNGLVGFRPDQFITNTAPSPVRFTGLETNSSLATQALDAEKELELTHQENVFTIKFALLNYIKPEKNKYAYRLSGFENHWLETNTPSVTYMNLKPGHYTLAVKGANNDGIWSTPRELSIVVLPPFWRTWWAYLSYAVLFSTILFFIIRYFYLQELIKKEEALHQHKLDFFTNVTHEIRTHLTLIMSPVDKMIADRANDGYLQQQFQNIKKNAGNLLRLSEELMDFRKAETENIKLQLAPHDIVAFVKNIYEHFTAVSLVRNMYISFTHDIQQETLYFDKEQLEKVFFNLINNAFKFTPDGGRIGVHITEDGPYIKVSVADNGRGIAPEYKDKLFNNFFQVNDSGSQNNGYGIGLALSSKIAALHGARIEVDSSVISEERGERKTVFSVFLQKGPVQAGQNQGDLLPKIMVDENSKTQEGAVLITEVPEPDFIETYLEEKKLSVLVVDDNPDIRSTVAEILSDKYQVLSEEDTAKGWTYATEHLPDIIVSDVMMPGEDGLSFCTRLKSDFRTCHIPVILLTAKTTQQDHIAGLNKGADIYLTKPFNRTILELTVRNLLATRERVRESMQQYVQNDLLNLNTSGNQPPQQAVNALDNEFLNDLLCIIEQYLDDPSFNIAVLSRKIGMSIPVLYKKMKAVTNLSVNDFIKSVKLQKAAALLQQNNLAVYEVCYAVGFQDRKHFSMEFRKKYGQSPKQYALSFQKEV